MKVYNNTNEELFVIGGEIIYRLFLEYSDKLYLTKIDDSFDKADSYFPYFNESDYEQEFIDENMDNNIKYQHILYKRKR